MFESLQGSGGCLRMIILNFVLGEALLDYVILVANLCRERFV